MRTNILLTPIVYSTEDRMIDVIILYLFHRILKRENFNFAVSSPVVETDRVKFDQSGFVTFERFAISTL